MTGYFHEGYDQLKSAEAVMKQMGMDPKQMEGGQDEDIGVFVSCDVGRMF